MKFWKIAFLMLAAFSLASCSSDDDNDVYEAAQLGGTWQKVYDEGVADAGMVQYTFHPQSANNGTVDIFTSDWAAGDTTVYRIYTITDAGHLQISPKPDDTSVALTGLKGALFRQRYQARLADDLLRYTDLPLAEIARRSGLGSQINLYQALRRDCNMSATERRHFLRQEGDEGRFEL